MTDLSQWGAGIDTGADDPDPDDSEDDESAGRSFVGGRCRAVKLGEGARCRGDVTGPMADRSEGLCPHHAQGRAPITIDDDPSQLIGATSGRGPKHLEGEIEGWPEIRAALEEVSAYQWAPVGEDDGAGE